MSDAIYPCDDCGVMRTKEQGGTVFTVCDKCWDRRADGMKPAAERDSLVSEVASLTTRLSRLESLAMEAVEIADWFDEGYTQYPATNEKRARLAEIERAVKEGK